MLCSTVCMDILWAGSDSRSKSLSGKGVGLEMDCNLRYAPGDLTIWVVLARLTTQVDLDVVLTASSSTSSSSSSRPKSGTRTIILLA